MAKMSRKTIKKMEEFRKIINASRKVKETLRAHNRAVCDICGKIVVKDRALPDRLDTASIQTCARCFEKVLSCNIRVMETTTWRAEQCESGRPYGYFNGRFYGREFYIKDRCVGYTKEIYERPRFNEPIYENDKS